MARIKRRVVQMTLFTTVLAAAGAAAYHFTSGDWTRVSRIFGLGGSSAELVADDAGAVGPVLSQSEMDAVASAWADTSSVQHARYEVPVDSDDAEYREATDSSPPVAQHATSDERYNPTNVTPAALPAEDSYSVARGQEPDGDDEILDEDEEPISPNPFSAPGQATLSSARAREAFSEQSAKDSAIPPEPAAGDRYNPATMRGMATDDNSPEARINPFAAVRQSPAREMTAAGSPPIATPNSREPAGLESPPTSQSQSHEVSGDYRQPEAIRSANAAYGAGSGGYASSSPTFGSTTMADPMDRRSPSQGDATATGMDGSGRPGERALEGPQKPSMVIQKFAPPEIQVGKPAKFQVQVRNVGGQTADEVVVRDELPHGTKLISTTPHADTDGSLLVWNLGALSTGEERTMEIELMPMAEGEIGSVATVTYAARASAKTRCTMPQLAVRMTAPGQVMIGQEQRVKIELRNPGTGDATGVMLFENVPSNVTHPAGQTLEFEIGTLRAGETRELELVLAAAKAGPVVNAITAKADGNLQVQQQVEFEVIAPALAVSVDGPERRYLERPATYQVQIENPGTAPAHDIELVTKLPKGMQFVRANNMGEYDTSTHAVYWSLAELPEGERGVVELVAMPVESGQQTLEVDGKAGQGLADHAKRDVLVEGLAAIMFEVRDAQDPIEVGRETSYEVRVVNQGTAPATNVQVVVNLPPGMQFISASGEPRYSAQGNGVVFEPLAKLAPKADTTYQIKVKGIQAGDQRVIVQVNTDDINQPIRREESTRVFGDD